LVRPSIGYSWDERFSLSRVAGILVDVWEPNWWVVVAVPWWEGYVELEPTLRMIQLLLLSPLCSIGMVMDDCVAAYFLLSSGAYHDTLVLVLYSSNAVDAPIPWDLLLFLSHHHCHHPRNA
jgi:hypothetical protein